MAEAMQLNLAPNERLVYMDDQYIEIDVLSPEGPLEEEPHDEHRYLYEQITDAVSKSNKCKKCINEGLTFCAGNNYMDGVCCNHTFDATCPRGRTDYEMQYWNPVNYCSDDNLETRAPYSWQYVVCPNEATCGDGGRKFITPSMSGEVLRRDIDKYLENSKFVQGDVCSWIVTNPLSMGNKDWMWLKIS
jgi:hypothetical protein